MDGIVRPGLTQRSSFPGTSSQFVYLRGGVVKLPHRPVALVHGEPYHQGWYV